LIVGIDRERVAHDLQHRQVGIGVAVGVRRREVVALLARELGHGVRFAGAVGVEEDLPGVRAVLDGHLGADGFVHAQPRPDRFDDLGAGGGDDDHIAAGRLVFGDELDRLLVDDRLHNAVECLAYDLADLFHVPAGGQLRQVDPHTLHLVVIGPGGQVHQLGVGALEDVGTADQSAGVERLCEGKGTRLGQDGLVEVEEGCRLD